MALKSCRSCGHDVARSAKACPSCGQKNPARRTSWWALGLILLVGLGIVASMDTEAPAAATPACEPVPDVYRETLIAGLSEGRALGRLSAVRSGAHQNAYFVAGQIKGTGQVAVWFKTGGLGDPGLTFSVDARALEYSGWGDASTTDAEATMSDPGAVEARACLDQ